MLCLCSVIRVVNEIHSSATKKNKEWQEKLPIVVLKAEEIMYSKANSEVVLFFFADLVTSPFDCLENVRKRKKTIFWLYGFCLS